MTKEEKKAKKFADLCEAVSEFIADHNMRNHHFLRNNEIIAAFSYAKKKHVKRAIQEVR